MTTTIYDQIRRHVDSAKRLIEWSNADITFGGDDDPDAAEHLKQAYEELDRASALIFVHRPTVRFHTVHVGALVGLDEHAPTEWVRVRVEETHATVPVLWSSIDGEVTS
jgi:hypothetical protein